MRNRYYCRPGLNQARKTEVLFWWYILSRSILLKRLMHKLKCEWRQVKIKTENGGLSKCSVFATLAIAIGWGWKSKLIGKKERNSLKGKELYENREEIWLCIRKENTFLNHNIASTTVLSQSIMKKKVKVPKYRETMSIRNVC